MSVELTMLYEAAGIRFRQVAHIEDVSVVLTPEGYRLQCPPPYLKYSRPFPSVSIALFEAERFCAMRRRLYLKTSRRPRR